MPASPRVVLAALMLVLALAPDGRASAAVDANTATQAQLETVSGIGPATAARILAARAAGPFRDLADLAARVRGIGEARARRMAAGGLVVAGMRPRPMPLDAAAPAPEVIVGLPVMPPPAEPPPRPGGRKAPARRAAKPRADSR